MKRKLGAQIAALRRSKGMTQEQLAAALGISSPAVSKWETDNSCPDITLLCPLARALGTDVDTLLQFEEHLSDEQIAESINRILETGRSQGAEKAEHLLQELLHEYPSSSSVKYHASAVFVMFRVMFPSAPAEKQEMWKLKREELLQEVHENKASPYRHRAMLDLASAAIEADRLEEAERLLEQLPEQMTDPTMSWMLLYLKRGETDKAKALVEKRLYTLVCQTQSCLTMLADKRMEPDVEKALEICEIYQKTEELFGCGGGMSAGIYAELYQRAGKEAEMLDCLIRFIDIITSPVQMPKPLLFSAVVKENEGQKGISREIQKMVLHGLETEEMYASLYEKEEFRAAVEKLRASIEK